MTDRKTIRAMGAVCILALALVAGAAACQTVPDKERLAAEQAFKSSVYAKDCGTDKYLAAKSLIEKARQQVNEKKYDEARISFSTAEQLLKEAEEEAANDPACNKALAEARKKEHDPVSERTIDGANVAGRTVLDPLDDPEASLRTVQFGFDSSDLIDQARDDLNFNAKWLERHGQVSITIQGHCDSRGSVEYNLALGERRADSVKRYLVQMGIAPDRMQIISFGEEKPVDDSDDEEAWARNRRAEFVKDSRKRPQE